MFPLIQAETGGARRLARLEFRVVGSRLEVSPPLLSVPKGIPGSILVTFAGSLDAELSQGPRVEALLRGPGLESLRLVGRVNEPLMLPPLNVVGDYQLDGIRLVDAEGKTKMEGTPSSIPVKVFDEVLVSKVVSRPLSLDEIKDKGITIDEQNFKAIEFEVGFVLDGKTIPVKFPVIAPTFKASTEIIPAAELEARLVEAAALNQQLAGEATLPPELEQSGLNIQIQGINFQRVDVGEGDDLALQIPPIPALMVIPGNIGFLNQFFSVQIFTENAAPGNSGLSVVNVEAKLVLPPGPDQLPSAEYSVPGDDPLRFARVDGLIRPVQKIVRPGADGKIGTDDDIPRLKPGESGQGEFLVEGLQEGLHVMDLDLTADLEGLAAGVVKVKGRAAGSVLVRNPKFSMAFTHPRTVRTGEPYEASVTILNTSPTVANEVSVTLPPTALSGCVLESAQTVFLGTIKPGETRTATYQILAQRTGAITFSNLSTSDDRLVGRFRLKMGIDERGVALSPDTIGMPDYVNDLPKNVVIAATRVLGQALSIATAGQLPPGVRSVPKSTVTRRVLELAEAGQRVRYGDGLERVLPDLLLDWQGGRELNAGFDQLLRVTEAGEEWREALFAEIEKTDTLNATERMLARSSDLAGRAEPWLLASTSETAVDLRLLVETNIVNAESSPITQALVYRGQRGSWMVFRSAPSALVEWYSSNETARAKFARVTFSTNGTGNGLTWNIETSPAGTCYTHAVVDQLAALVVDLNCDGTQDLSIEGQPQTILEAAPELLAVHQDSQVRVGRPFPSCLPVSAQNYGTVLAVLFSKPMVQSTIDLPDAYALENGNTANSVQIQPGGRVALLNMKWPLGGIRSRTMTVTGVTDARGNTITGARRAVQKGLMEGTAIKGKVVRADGSPAAGIPVTLTMYDEQLTGFADCLPFVVRVSQVYSDVDGFFNFDFVLAGIPYSLSATDTGGLTTEMVELILQSASGDAFNREKLLELANSASVQNTLLAEFAVGALPEAVAKAEGLDRALMRDLILPGSGRIGTETPVALRFRGRGTVTGTILAADGLTRVPQTAVNLFPDPDSREQGRGIYSDSNGRFAFYGVPLGTFSVQAVSPGAQARTISEVIEQPGTIKDIEIILSTNRIVTTELKGRVLETDNVTPHANALVFVGRFLDGKFQNVVAVVRADEQGFWTATVPADTYDVAAVSFDGKRKGDRRDILAALGASTQVTITLQGRANVIGRVENSIGQPVANALVAGGETIVRTDGNGFFTLPGVPTGIKSISAGQERNLAAGIKFPRLGSTTLNVLPGIDNFAVIRLRPAGSITGRVLDALGDPVPNARVAIPQENGFLWVEANAEGKYLFENLAPGKYTLSAPGPAVANTDTAPLLNQIRSGSEDEILAAIGEAFAIFTGASDPFLNGEGDRFNPLTWGYTETTIRFDQDLAVADIGFLREGTVSGVVLNPQGVPIGARVRLTGIGPLANGQPSMVIRGERNSDPALGTFEFPKQLLEGPWGIQVASPFFAQVITTNGQTTSFAPDALGIVMQFPPDRDNKGRLVGRIFYPDGSPVTNAVNVHISLSADYSVTSDTNGVYDTVQTLNAGAYSVIAKDPVSGLEGMSSVEVKGGIVNICDVRLIGKGSLTVFVKMADGTAAAGANVLVQQGGFPNDEGGGVSDSAGRVQLSGLFAGNYAIQASKVVGVTTIQGRTGGSVPRDSVGVATVVLAPTAKIKGTFVKRDRATPVSSAQVAIGSLGFATTDATGRFELDGIPLGTYRLVTQDPVSGIGAIATVTLSVVGETQEVLLVEQFRGEVRGLIINSYGNGFVPGATVTLHRHDGITPARSVTTGPDGAYSFPGTPSGTFEVKVEDPITRLTGSRSGNLPENTPSVTVDVPLQPLGAMTILVFRPDGVTPARNATVGLRGAKTLNSDTDENGQVRFTDLPLGQFQVIAASLILGETRSVGETTLNVGTAGSTVEGSIRLGGVGRVTGKIFLSDGVTPAPGAQVNVQIMSRFSSGQAETALANAEAEFSIANIPVGEYRVSAQAEALAAGVNAAIQLDGEVDRHEITLGASGTITGQLVRADGITEVSDIDVLIAFNSQSGLPGQSFVRSGANGDFKFDNIPVGNFRLSAVAPAFTGIIRFDSELSSNGENKNVGKLKFDEDDPVVLAVSPFNTEAGVATTTAVNLYFNEALDPASIARNGIFLRSATGTVLTTIELLPDPTNSISRLVRLTPATRLLSEQTYEVIVVDGERRDALGSVIGTGPVDLVGRYTIAPFISRFTTADNDPPLLLSVFPTNAAVQIDIRSVVRLAFNEPVQNSNINFSLTGPGGNVVGELTTTLNGQALTFVPGAALEPNATYQLHVEQVKDLAGNLLADPVDLTFQTTDTKGPEIVSVKIEAGLQPLAGTTVPYIATLAAPEPGVTVSFTQDQAPIGNSTNPPFAVEIKLPASGSTMLTARASDRFGNFGALHEITIQTTSNLPPAIQFVRVAPATGPVASGTFVSVDVLATDDSKVTNLRAIASGALRSDLQGTNSTRLRVQGIVPASAHPAQKIRIVAEASDDTGQSSGEQVLEIDITDATKPLISVLSPSAGAVISLEDPLQLQVETADNSQSVQLQLELTGGISETATFDLPLTPNLPATHTFTIPVVDPPTNGVTISATIRATDAAGNFAIAVREFRLPDLRPPLLASFTPPDGSANVGVLPELLLRFDEPVQSVSAQTLQVLTEGTPVSGIISVLEQGKLVSWKPAFGLEFNRTYQVKIGPGITDTAANELVPSLSTFTTTSFAVTAPATNVDLVESQRLAVQAGGANASGIQAVAFDAAGSSVFTVATAFNGELLAPLISDAGGTSIVMFARAVLTNGTANLINNGGADDALNEGRIPGWIPDNTGEWTQGSSPAPHTGPAYFAPPAGAKSELQQDIDLSAMATRIDGTGVYFAFETRLRAGVDGDIARVIIEFRSGESILTQHEFTNGEDSTQWKRFSFMRAAAAGTRTIRVRLVATNAGGDGNQAYFDSVQLTAFPAVLVGQRSLTLHPINVDSDSDGLVNSLELEIGSNPFLHDASTDTDGDGLSNAEELVAGTHPGNPDTDEDGLNDKMEITLTTNPLDPDTDDDGVLDGSDSSPLTKGAAPTLTSVTTIETIEGIRTNLAVLAKDPDANLDRLYVTSSLEQTGLHAAFYNHGRSLGSLGELDFNAQPAHTQKVAVVSFTSEPFWPGGPDSFYGTKVTGKIKIPTSGTYRFYTSSDDGSQLFIDGKLVVNNDGLHGVAERSELVTLSAGLHPFEVTFFENGGGAFLQASWEGPGISKQLIPAEAFLDTPAHWPGGANTLYAQSMGGFLTGRGGDGALVGGTYAETFRSSLTTNFPLLHLEGSDLLTPEFLARQKLLFITSLFDGTSSLRVPLSPSEQVAVRTYIEAGGAAILLVDNSQHGGNADTMHESVLDPIGFDAAGTISGLTPAQVVDNDNPITSGPFEVLFSYSVLWPGWFDGMPENARVLARLESNNQPTLAYLPPGVLSSGSGPVLLSSEHGIPNGILLNMTAHAGITNKMRELAATLVLEPMPRGTSIVQIVAIDADSLTATQEVTVVTLPDTDRDGIPDRDDNDNDGDGLSDDAELLAGTNPENPDTDADTIKDGLDPQPLAPTTPPAGGVLVEGSSLEFDGLDDHALADTAHFAIRDELTISAWFKNTDDFSVEQHGNYLLTKAPAGGAPWQDYGLILGSDRTLQFEVVNESGVAFRVTSGVLSDTVHHAAATYSSSSGHLRLYIDGSLVALGEGNGRIRHNGTRFFVGDWNGNSTWHFWHGQIDEVQVWNRVLNHQEIRGTMFRHLDGTEPGLAAYFPFDENTGSRSYSPTPSETFLNLGQGNSTKSPAWMDALVKTRSAPVFQTAQNSTIKLVLPGAPEGAGSTGELIAQPENGKVFLSNSNGEQGIELTSFPAQLGTEKTLFYQPQPTFRGTEILRYTLNNGVEDSAPTTALVLVMPVNAAPAALADVVQSFQDVPVTFDVVANDADPDGTPFRVGLITQPANGKAILNADGSLTYQPNPGFFGTDTFAYTLVDEVFWRRRLDWTPGVAHNSTLGNPDDGMYGWKVWRYEHLSGAPLGDRRPWYLERGTPLQWDASWFGGIGFWTRGDDVSPPITPETLVHVGSGMWPFIPAVRWVSPFNDFSIDVRGTLRLAWSGNDNVGSPMPLDVVLARQSRATGVVDEFYTNRLSKPIPSDTVGDFVDIPVNFDGITMNRGDSIVVSVRALSDISGRWFYLTDDLYILPHSTENRTTVTLNVTRNAAPQLALREGNALSFDGANDYVDLGNPPALQITGNQTIEFWIKLGSYNGRQNPIAKAYAGEGTMTIEGNGVINYYYGNLGQNGGGGDVNYQGVTSDRALALNVWTHVALVRDFNSGKVLWYFDGAPAGQAATIFSAATAGPNSFTVGRGYVNHLHGQMDELRVWNVARSRAEIEGTRFSRLTGTETGLAGYWNFDEGEGRIANDLSAENVTGRLGGAGNESEAPAWVPALTPFESDFSLDEDTAFVLALTGTDLDGDPLSALVTLYPDVGNLFQTADGLTAGASVNSGSAVRFDGTDIITIEENPANDLSSFPEWTITAWVRPDRFDNEFPTIYSEGHWQASLGLQRGTGRLESYVNNRNPLISSKALPLNLWSHVAVVFTGRERRFYINGTLAGVSASEAPGPNTSGAAIGGIISEPGNPRSRFDGAIDEVAIWKVGLSENKILHIMNNPTSTADAALAALWRFEEGTGETAIDSASTGLVGTFGFSDPATRPTWIGSTAPVLGGIAVQHPEDKVVYVPPLNFSGRVLLGYKVNDGKVSSKQGILVLGVRPVNDEPVANSDTNNTVQGFPITISNVLVNDTDVEGQQVAVLDFTQPGHGTVSSNGDGSFRYVPVPDFIGQDFFTYRATDGLANSAPATVFINVSAADEFRWVNPAGGSWHIASNWSRGIVPGPNDSAVVDLDGDYTVRVDGHGDVRRVVFGGATGTQHLVIDSNFTVREESRLNTNATLELRTGELNGPGLLRLGKRFDWVAGLVRQNAAVEIEPGAEGLIGGGGDRYLMNGGRLINRGTLTITSTRIMLDNQNVAGAALENHGTMHLVEGAQVAWNNWSNDRPVFLRNFGLITRRGTTTHSVLSAPYSGNGILDLTEGLLVIAHNYHLQGTLRSAPDTILSVQGGHFTAPPEAVFDLRGRIDFAGTSGMINNSAVLPSVRVLGGSFQFLGAPTFTTLVLAGGELTGTATITVTDAFEWSGGNMWDPGILQIGAGATATVSGAGDRYLLNGRILLNQGTMVAEGPRILLDNRSRHGATLRNAGNLTLRGPQGVIWNNWSGDRLVAFINEGTLTREGDGTSDITTPFSNSGTTMVQAGVLRLIGGASNTGSLQFAAGTTLAIAGGTSTFAAPGSITGEGFFSLDAGTGVFTSEVEGGGRFRVNGGTWVFNGAQNMTQLNFSSGEIQGTGHILVTEQLNWSGGNFWSSGTIEIGETAVVQFPLGGDRYLLDGRKFINKGTFTASGGRLLLDNRSAAGATFENRGTMICENEFDVIWNNWSSDRPVQIRNLGTWRKIGEVAAMTELNGGFNNEGLLHVQSGQVRFANGFNQSGILQLDSNGHVILGDGYFSSTVEAVIAGEAGRITFQRGSSDFLNSFDFDGLILVEDGSWRLNTNQAIAHLELRGGDFGGVGQLTVSSNLNWLSGTISGQGELIIAPAATAALSSGGGKIIRNGRKLINRGTLQATGHNLLLDNLNLAGATFLNEGTATFADEIDIVWNNWSSDRPVFFKNAGHVIKEGLGTTTSSSVYFENSGLLEVREGTFNLSTGSSQIDAEWNIDPSGTLLLNGGEILQNLQVSGTGEIIFSSQVELRSDINFATLRVTFNGAATLTGSANLSNEPGGVLLLARALTLNGNLDVAGTLELTGNFTFNINGTLTLESTGKIINPGSILVVDFIDNGGEIQQNPPVKLAPALPFAIENIAVTLPPSGGIQAFSALTRVVTLEWHSRPDAFACVQVSEDLVTWKNVDGRIVALPSGLIRATIPFREGAPQFFRLQLCE